jgi:hypothetical protein
MAVEQEIYIQYGAKMSKNYQSADMTVGIKLQLMPADDPDRVTEKWHEKLKTFVHNKLRTDLGELT